MTQRQSYQHVVRGDATYHFDAATGVHTVAFPNGARWHFSPRWPKIPVKTS